jgi:coniferyl-aldehyde dehydrogenase
MRIAEEEIFGPGVAVMGYSELTEAIDYINQRPAPLVAYWFGPDHNNFRTLSPTRAAAASPATILPHR